MGRHHARVLSGLAGVSLELIVDPQLGNDGPNGVSVFPDCDVLAGHRIDMAVVAAPTAAHEEIALQLADAGIHTLVEKPLAATFLAAQRVAEAFRSRGLVGCVGHIERYNPSLLALRKRLSDGQLGEVYQVVTRRQGPFPVRVRDVGVIMDLATHDLDLVSWATGDAYLAVSAHMSRRSGREHEDMVTIGGSLRSGAMINHLVNWLSPLKERVTVVTGANGCLVADTISGDLTFYENGHQRTEWETVAAFRGVVQGDVIRYAIPKREPLLVELEAFRDAILGSRGETVAMADAAETVRVAEAVRASCDLGGQMVAL